VLRADARARRSSQSFLAGRTFIIFTRSAAFREPELLRTGSLFAVVAAELVSTSWPDNREYYDIAHVIFPPRILETDDERPLECNQQR